MTAREVNPDQWKSFCDRITRTCKGALVSIELQQRDGTSSRVARDVPLAALALDTQSDPCNTNLVFAAGESKPLQHVAVEPIHIRLRTDGQGDRYSHLEVIAENGTTRVTLRPGIPPDVLEGMDGR